MASNVTGMAKGSELRRRILFTLLMLAIYRIGIFISVPGIDREVIQNFVSNSGRSFLSLFNMFSGGGLEQFSIFAMGVVPYITSSIIFQLLTMAVPSLDQLQKEGEQGRKKINQYTRYGAIVIAMVQGYFMVRLLKNSGAILPQNHGLSFTIMTMLTLTTGTMFVMWLGEQITERGIGNGTSLIIFSGIVARFPNAVWQLFQKSSSQDLNAFQLLIIGSVIVLVVAAVIFFERGFRKIPIEYAKRVIGGREYVGQAKYLPLKINVSGVIPPLFASALLMFPAQIAQFTGAAWLQKVANFLEPVNLGYNVIFVILIIFFCYFYAAVTFNPLDVADNLKKNGGFIPGIRPGQKTADYLDHVLSRITLGGGIYIALVCVLPVFLQRKLDVPFYFGGTSLLIVVGVALDTVQQIQNHLISQNYDNIGAARGLRPGMRSIRARA